MKFGAFLPTLFIATYGNTFEQSSIEFMSQTGRVGINIIQEKVEDKLNDNYTNEFNYNYKDKFLTQFPSCEAKILDCFFNIPISEICEINIKLKNGRCTDVNFVFNYDKNYIQIYFIYGYRGCSGIQISFKKIKIVTYTDNDQ